MRLALPSKGRMAEDTIELFKVCRCQCVEPVSACAIPLIVTSNGAAVIQPLHACQHECLTSSDTLSAAHGRPSVVDLGGPCMSTSLNGFVAWRRTASCPCTSPTRGSM